MIPQSCDFMREMTHWSIIMALVLMVFGGSLSVAQDETEEHENVVFDYLILPPMEDDPGGSTRPKKIFQLLPVNSENAKNMMGLEGNPMKQAPQAPYIETVRHSLHNQEPPPAARHRNPELPRRLMHTPQPPRQSQRDPESARHPQRDPNPHRHSHYSPDGNQPPRHGNENPHQPQYKPDRGRHRHHDPNSPRHAHHKLKTTRNHYETATPQVQYHSVEKIRIADPNPDIISVDNSFVPEKTGIPYLDSGSITGHTYVNPENNVSPYNSEIKISNYGNPMGTMNYGNLEATLNYGNPDVSALPYVHPDITVTNYAAEDLSIKPYVNPYRNSDISQNAYNIQPRTEDPYYVPGSTEHSSRRADRTDTSYDVAGNRKYKYYGKPQADSDEIDNNTYGSTTVIPNRHHHQPQVEKRDDFFASYDRDYSTVATKQAYSTGKPVLECYSCYSSAKTSRACIEPTKHGVGVLPCKDPRELCYSTFLKSGSYYLSIQRGCMLECHDSIVTECCSQDRCNFKKPPAAVQKLASNPQDDCATQHGPPSILFFLTILLVLHTVVKVAYL